MQLLAKQNKIQSKINRVMGKVSKQHKRLVDLDRIVNFDVLKTDEEAGEEEK